MSNARNLSKLIPSASGQIQASDIESGAVESSLGYTPVNKAGDTMSGVHRYNSYLSIGKGPANNDQITFNAIPDNSGNYTPQWTGSASAGGTIIGIPSGGNGGLEIRTLRFGTNNSSQPLSAYPARFAMTDGGVIQMPYQPAFHAYPGTTVTVSSGNNKFIFNSTRFNIGGHYSTSTGRFTAPVSGVYLFTFQVYYYPGSTSDSYQGLNMFKNGTAFYVGYARGGYGDTTWGNSIHLYMSANDYIEFYTYPSNSYNLNTLGSYLTGHLVG